MKILGLRIIKEKDYQNLLVKTWDDAVDNYKISRFGCHICGNDAIGGVGDSNGVVYKYCGFHKEAIESQYRMLNG